MTGSDLPEGFLQGLEALGLGPRLLTNEAELIAFGSDALTSFHQRPLAVVVAESASEVVETVRLCDRFGVPFVARGSGTSLSGGSLPVEGGIVIALNRLDRLIELDPDTRTAVVEPGMINSTVSEIAREHGLSYAPDPSSQQICARWEGTLPSIRGAHTASSTA